MHVGVLGPLLVSVDGQDVTPPGQRLRDVLTVLLQRRGRPVPAPVILDLVWGEQAAGLSGAPVHTVIARLRRLLGSAAISTHEVGYLVDGATSTDEDSFAAVVQHGGRLQDRGHWAAAAEAYRNALAHWRGGVAFDGVSDEIVEADRARLADLRVAVVQDLVTMMIDHPEAGDTAEAARLAAELIEQRPLQERPYQLAMLAAYRGHRQADALAIFERLRRRLRRELGIDPSPASTLLQAAILAQDSSLAAAPPAVTGVLRSIRVRATGPPAAAGPLVGRERELDGLLAALNNGHRVVTLVGPGGVGKTRLMVEVAARRQDRDIIYAELTGPDRIDADELAEALALGQGIPAARRTAMDAVIAALSIGRWLVMIDEAERAGTAVAGLVGTIVEHSRTVQFVVTSRRPLDVPGEHLMAIAPLTCPSPEDAVPAILAAPAVRFLLERLADHAAPVDDERSAALDLAAITRRVDGLPLALELLAGQAATRSLGDLALLARTPLDISTTQPAVGARHRSLREALTSTTDLLDPASRIVLSRLAVFAGSFDIAAAGGVVGPLGNNPGPADAGDPTADRSSVASIVRVLVRDALIQVDRRDAAGLRFRVLLPIRDLALTWCDSQELAATRRRHRRWHADRWRGHPRLDEVIEDVRLHYEDFTLALQSALEERDGGATTDLCLVLSDVWRLTGARGAGLRWTTRVLDTGDLLPAAERAAVRIHRASLALRHRSELALADTAAAIPVLQSAAAQSGSQESSAAASLVNAYLVAAIEQLAGGRREDGIRQVDRAVEVARRSPGRLATALSVQAYVHAAAGDPSIAATAIAEVETSWEAMGSTSERAVVCGNVAYALLTLDRPREALDLLDGLAPAILRVLGAAPDFYLLDTGWAALGSDELERALECFGVLLDSGSPIPADRQSVETFIGTACVLAWLGHPRAGRALDAALALADAIGVAIAPPLSRPVERALAELGDTFVRTGPVSGPADLLATSLAADLRLTVAAVG